MISIRTNLSSIITQNNMGVSSNKLNTAIERMTTGYKINHAGDNAANYSISKNMNTQLSACDVAADNIAMGIDMLSTAQDTIAGMQERGSRIHALITQARNGTYGADSLDAMKQEAQALVNEINRLYKNTEYNGIKLFDGVELPDWAQELKNKAGKIDGKSLEDIAAKNRGFIEAVPSSMIPRVIVTDPNELASAISSNTEIGIGNAQTLARLAELVNSGTSCSGKTIFLTEDIDLKNSSWTTSSSNAYDNSESVDMDPKKGEDSELVGKGPKGGKESESVGKGSETGNERDGVGGKSGTVWVPIGTIDNPFQGKFVGNGHKITGLYIDNSDSEYQGLFGAATGNISYLCIEDASVIGGNNSGILAGVFSGKISNCYVTGTVKGKGATGGLVGKLEGEIKNCYAICNVTGGDYAGGLVGFVDGAITNSYSTGNVTGSNYTGGLAGYALGAITNSYSTGNVAGNDATGGLAGGADGAITNSYSTGNVTGKDFTGGLVGKYNDSTKNSYSTGYVKNAYGTNTSQYYFDGDGDVFRFELKPMNLQVGINSDSDSQISVDTKMNLNLSVSNLTSDGAYNSITHFLNQLSEKATALGAAQNRLESALESNLVKMDNLTSSLSTIRDADISEVSSDFIRQQILQQAAATLMSTANQAPSIALQLI